MAVEKTAIATEYISWEALTAFAPILAAIAEGTITGMSERFRQIVIKSDKVAIHLNLMHNPVLLEVLQQRSSLPVKSGIFISGGYQAKTSEQVSFIMLRMFIALAERWPIVVYNDSGGDRAHVYTPEELQTRLRENNPYL